MASLMDIGPIVSAYFNAHHGPLSFTFFCKEQKQKTSISIISPMF